MDTTRHDSGSPTNASRAEIEAVMHAWERAFDASGAGSLRHDTSMSDDTLLYFNPACTNCIAARGLLDERGEHARIVEYLVERPTREQLQRLMEMLEIDDPREMIRTKEAEYESLALATASPDAVLDAITEHPILLQRPILVRGDRAVIGRPPERILELLP
jgi:arsenate reductase (glutaredoxin)